MLMNSMRHLQVAWAGVFTHLSEVWIHGTAMPFQLSFKRLSLAALDRAQKVGMHLISVGTLLVSSKTARRLLIPPIPLPLERGVAKGA